MMNLKIQFLVLHLVAGLSSVQSCTNGDTNNIGCVPERCIGGKWVPADPNKILTGNCKRCVGFGDPHFDTFSGAKFSWQVTCNFALVQEGTSLEPRFGVFMNFRHIHDGFAHVGGPTIYQENINTKVELNPTDEETLFNVIVNGRQQNISQEKPTLLHGTSVSAWKHSLTDIYENSIRSSHCLRMYGENHILIELCESQISIWAPKHSSYPHRLGGLCGSPDSTSKRLVARDGITYDDPGNWGTKANLTFGNSWQAKVQYTSSCPKLLTQRRKRSLSELSSEQLHLACLNEANIPHGTHHELCVEAHPGINFGGIWDDHHDACKYDLCVVANGTGYQQAGFTVAKMLEHHREIHHRERIHNPNHIESAPSGVPIAQPAPIFGPESAPSGVPIAQPAPIFGPVIVGPSGIVGPDGSNFQGSFQQSQFLPSQPEGFSPNAPVLFVGPSGSVLQDGTLIQFRNDANLAEELSKIAPDSVSKTNFQSRRRPIGNTNFQSRRPNGNTNFQHRTRPIGNTNFQRRTRPIGNTNFQSRRPNGNTNFQQRTRPIGNTNFQRRTRPTGNTNFQSRSPLGNTNFQHRTTPIGNTNFQHRRNLQPQRSPQLRQWG